MSRAIGKAFAVALIVAGACKPDLPPRESSHPLNTPAAVPATAEPSFGQRDACGAAADMLRKLAAEIGDSSSAVSSPRDTTSWELSGDRNVTETACTVAWSDSTHQAPLDSLYGLLERDGWQHREGLLMADGPDGSALAWSRGDAACIVDGSWDGHDDSDSTDVPKPGFRIRVTCLHNRRDRYDVRH